jgi:HK97 gp10 family phage protein
MMGVKQTGGDDVARALRALTASLPPDVQAAILTAAAAPIAERMAELAPVGSGAKHLRDEIVIAVTPGDADGDAVVAIGPSTRVFYGSFQEFGTRWHPPQAFARPAFNREWPTALDIAGEEAWKALERGAP